LEQRLRSGVDERDYLNTGYILLGSDVRLAAIMISSGSRERSRILEARARVLLGPVADKAADGARDDAAGETAASPGATAEPGVPVVSVMPLVDEPGAERALPPRGTLEDGTGLWVPPRPRASAAPAQEDGVPANVAEGDQGTLRLDLAAAGFMPEPLPPLPAGVVVAHHARVLLVVDVWEDGRVTSVLVQKSSGVLTLDQAARAAAAGWRSAGKVPAGGERRGVAVEFLPPRVEPPLLR
jgi:TonB family protein